MTVLISHTVKYFPSLMVSAQIPLFTPVLSQMFLINAAVKHHLLCVRSNQSVKHSDPLSMCKIWECLIIQSHLVLCLKNLLCRQLFFIEKMDYFLRLLFKYTHWWLGYGCICKSLHILMIFLKEMQFNFCMLNRLQYFVKPYIFLAASVNR